jgi:hypothetical protein
MARWPAARRSRTTRSLENERFGGAAQFRPLQPDRPGGGFDRYRPISVARTGVSVGAAGVALVAFATEELGDLGLQRCLHQ